MNGALLISTRNREVWLNENMKLLMRLCKMLNSAEVGIDLHCQSPVCPDPKIRMTRDDTDPGGRILQCGCKSRHCAPRHTTAH